jgi:hypothetical protein
MSTVSENEAWTEMYGDLLHPILSIGAEIDAVTLAPLKTLQSYFETAPLLLEHVATVVQNPEHPMQIPPDPLTATVGVNDPDPLPKSAWAFRLILIEDSVIPAPTPGTLPQHLPCFKARYTSPAEER